MIFLMTGNSALFRWGDLHLKFPDGDMIGRRSTNLQSGVNGETGADLLLLWGSKQDLN